MLERKQAAALQEWSEAKRQLAHEQARLLAQEASQLLKMERQEGVLRALQLQSDAEQSARRGFGLHAADQGRDDGLPHASVAKPPRDCTPISLFEVFWRHRHTRCPDVCMHGDTPVYAREP
jgi:hypothetical protein